MNLQAPQNAPDAPADPALPEALQGGEELFPLMVEHSIIGVYVLVETRLLYVNQGFCDIMGLSREYLLGGEELSPYIHPRDREMLHQTSGQMLRDQGPIHRLDFRIIRPDGEIRWVQLFASPVMYHGQPALLGNLIDITERVLAETALRNSEEHYRLLADNVQDMIWSLDLNLRLTYISPSCERFLGYSVDENLRLTPRELLTPEFHAEALALYERELAMESSGAIDGPPRTHQFEAQMYRKDGTPVWVEFTGNFLRDGRGQPVGLMGVTRNIDQRKTAEDARRESEEMFRSLVDNMVDAAFVVDYTGTVLFGNQATARLVDLPRPEDIIGRTMQDFISPEWLDRAYNEMQQFVLDGNGHLSEHQIITSTGAARWVEALGVKSTFRGKPACLVTFRDIEERKHAEEEKLRLEAQLRQAQKMEAIGTLAGGIAHDFNNILAAIIGYTEIATLQVGNDHKAYGSLEKVLTACERAKSLVAQILSFSRRGPHELKPVQLAPVIKEALKLLRASLPATIEIRQNISTDAGIVQADPTQIHQVVMNLCTNAAHAIGETPGEISVDLCPVRVDEPCAARHPDLHTGPYLRLTVKDTGCGIAPDILDRIFEPYFTTKSKDKGTGLGLAVIHGIVSTHGGAITVESNLGQDTTFAAYLPRIEQESPGCESSNPAPLPTGNEHILFVDDEQDLVDIGQQMLQHLGYRVTTCTSSMEALELFRRDPRPFDLVITDMTMPRMTGERLTREMLAIRPGLPVIICTGFSSLMNEERARELGIRGFLMKPLKTSEIALTIRSALDAR